MSLVIFFPVRFNGSVVANGFHGERLRTTHDVLQDTANTASIGFLLDPTHSIAMNTPKFLTILLRKKFFNAKQFLSREGGGGVFIFPFMPVERIEVDAIVLKPGTFFLIELDLGLVVPEIGDN